MDTIHMPADLDRRIASAVEYFWTTRTGQITRQTANGVRDQGNRGAVTGGKQLDGFVELIHDLLTLNGVPEECIFINSDLELPGYFRPNKKWDLLVVDSPYSTINCDDLNLAQYPEVKSLKDFKEKMMLILYIITSEGKGQWFTTADILCLMTDIFGESATKKQVEGVFKREKRWFKCENIEGSNKFVHRKLLNEGKSYAQSLTVATE